MRRMAVVGWHLSALLICVGLSTGARAQITKTGNGYLFRVKYYKGMHLDYIMTVTSQPPGSSQGVTLSMPVSSVVTEMQGGIATVQITSGPATMNGKSMGQPAQTFVIKLDNTGKMVGGKMPGLQGLTAQMPTRPLKVGDTYPFKQSLNVLGRMPITANSLYKFIGIKTVGGKQVAELDLTVTGSGSIPLGQGQTGTFHTKGAGTVDLGMEDGQVVQMKADQTMTLKQGTNTMDIRSTTVMKRK